MIKIQITVKSDNWIKAEKAIKRSGFKIHVSRCYYGEKSNLALLQFTASIKGAMNLLNDLGRKRINASCIAYEVSPY